MLPYLPGCRLMRFLSLERTWSRGVWSQTRRRGDTFMLKKTLIFIAASIAVTAFAVAGKLGIELGTIGSGATAQWVNTNANGNGKDQGHKAVQLCKNVATSEFEAAGADITGVNGTPVTS